MAITVMNREHPIRLSSSEAADFERIMGRFSLQLREPGDD
jgi:hypothetical protein